MEIKVESWVVKNQQVGTISRLNSGKWAAANTGAQSLGHIAMHQARAPTNSLSYLCKSFPVYNVHVSNVRVALCPDYLKTV
jgi:hypothetical protein